MRCVLGFDGGGTKTECVLMDERENVLARARSGASNPGRVGFESALAALQEAAEAAIFESGIERGEVLAMCAGLSGGGSTQTAEKMHRGMAAAFPNTTIKICTDLEIALAAMGDGPAVVLIAGTGSAAVGCDVKGLMRREGGLGRQLGDEGSATHIGKKAVLAAKLHREQTGEESPLGKQLLRQLGVANWVLQDRYPFLGSATKRPEPTGDEREPDTYPRLFPVVANAAEAGDEIARGILREAAGDLASLVDRLLGQLDLRQVPFRLAKTGGMIGRCAFFDLELDRRLGEVAPNAEIGLLPMSPAHAAALMALELVRSAG
jgi:N-acetylglucosamine kinase-like BadF-type ATPase